MADLITLAELRGILGIDPTNTVDDLQYTALIPAASAAVRAYTERDFGAATVLETRDFSYDGSGFLDIDDAQSISSVSFLVPNADPIVLDADSWAAMPPRRDDSPIYTYIQMPAYVGYTTGSPEMGFARNLDVYARERGPLALPSNIQVAATWGWPTVPADVKLATVWTVKSWFDRPSGSDALTGEAIEGWSRTWGGKGSQAAALAIPSAARDILSFYSKIEV